MASLFRTGFAVDAIAPLASTSTLPGAPGSASRKRKRTQNEEKTVELASASSKDKGKHVLPATSTTAAAADDSGAGLSHNKNFAVEAAQVNIEKLMKKLQQMEGNGASSSSSSKANKDVKKKAKHNDTDSSEKGKLKSDLGRRSPAHLGSQSKSHLNGKSDVEGEDGTKNSEGDNKKQKTEKSKPKKGKRGEREIGSATDNREQITKSDYVPDEAALAKREERKKKKATKAAAAAAAAAEGGDTTVDMSAMEAEGASAPQADRTAVDGPLPTAVASSAAPAGTGESTNLQKKMQQKLGGARFRWINEQLYTNSGQAAQELMKEDPALFEDYHSGFRSQAASWPEQPIRNFIRYFETRYTASTEPRPVIADLGCGEAELAQTLVPKGFPVVSYDLVEQLPYVVRAQCTERLPLPGALPSESSSEEAAGAIVDYVVCCLSLMGSDWLGMIREAKRVLRKGGKLKIAEVTSRFTDIDAFVELLSAVGFKLLSKDTSNTHFVLFDFQTVAKAQIKSSLSHLSSLEMTAKSQQLLKPCIYKRR